MPRPRAGLVDHPRRHAAVLGPAALVPALEAFVSGYRVALAISGVLLLVGALIAFVGLRAPRPVPAPGSRAH